MGSIESNVTEPPIAHKPSNLTNSLKTTAIANIIPLKTNFLVIKNISSKKFHPGKPRRNKNSYYNP
jgi:hypothetical protein